ncbi:hypothetical protein [Streptomyces inhibens]|uniref:hypothetical protein n=1 Tax=Streptomyces inhibens TaxID=2293571 RepID=UPI001EE6D42E|nr:hypothetical protein [Streptomyces inhibens]UKY48207.1 hypothetical protein KI385_04875 [Streptomyces inhibens]
MVIEQISRSPCRHLMLCSKDSRELRFFERHPRWARAGPFVVMSNLDDSPALQDGIQDIKANKGLERASA